jgi:cytochrome c551/c552
MTKVRTHRWKSGASYTRLGTVSLLFALSLGCADSKEPVDWPPSEKDLVTAQNQALLNESALPIDQAMALYASKGRGANPAIAVKPSEDFSAVDGWSFAGGAAPTGEAVMPPECESTPDPLACWGEKLRNQKGCVACHGIDGVAQQPAPNWRGIFGTNRALADGETVVVDEQYIRSSIVDPWGQLVEGYGKVMPPQNLQEPEIEAIVAYIKSLGAS